jgi:hypothetical protein
LHDNNPSDSNDHNDFDGVVVAPGPCKPCLLWSQWPHLMIDLFFGGSFMPDLSWPLNSTSRSNNNNNNNNKMPLLPPDLLEHTPYRS